MIAVGGTACSTDLTKHLRNSNAQLEVPPLLNGQVLGIRSEPMISGAHGLVFIPLELALDRAAQVDPPNAIVGTQFLGVFHQIKRMAQIL